MAMAIRGRPDAGRVRHACRDGTAGRHGAARRRCLHHGCRALVGRGGGAARRTHRVRRQQCCGCGLRRTEDTRRGARRPHGAARLSGCTRPPGERRRRAGTVQPQQPRDTGRGVRESEGVRRGAARCAVGRGRRLGADDVPGHRPHPPDARRAGPRPAGDSRRGRRPHVVGEHQGPEDRRRYRRHEGSRRRTHRARGVGRTDRRAARVGDRAGVAAGAAADGRRTARRTEARGGDVQLLRHHRGAGGRCRRRRQGCWRARNARGLP